MTAAVLVIDVQQALCAGRWACFETARMIDRINSVTGRARAAGVAVVLVQHEEDDGEMRRGTPGWQLAEGLETAPTDLRVFKRASDSFHETDLLQRLQERGVTELVVCGLQSDFCVDSTTRRALAQGYPVVLVSDGHSTMDNEVLTAAQISAHHTVTLANLSSFGRRVRPLPAIDVRFDG